MSRIELWTTVFAGLAGGLSGVLWSGLVTTPWLARKGGRAPEASSAGSVARVLAGAALRATGGAALGFLFWLGWGLIAVVGLPWYGVGVLYGALAWTALALPILGSMLAQGNGAMRDAAVHGVEWLYTCLATGLLCALSWYKYT